MTRGEYIMSCEHTARQIVSGMTDNVLGKYLDTVVFYIGNFGTLMEQTHYA